METVFDISYGVVPFHRSSDGVRVLLIHQIGSRGDVFWTLPKGHPEAGESPLHAAQRELREETGITLVDVDAAASFSMHYQFTFEGKIIDKTVTFYLGHVASPETHISQPEEVAALGWFTKAEALLKVNHAEVRRILEDAFAVMKE
jgi:8-oxo-dGTP pyrophosphatase MutT (NUDIX family)